MTLQDRPESGGKSRDLIVDLSGYKPPIIDIDVPEKLAEVVSPNQFIGYSHLVEFWRVYKKRPHEVKLVRSTLVDSGFIALGFFRPRWTKPRTSGVALFADDPQALSMREESGLVVYSRAEDGVITPASTDYHKNSKLENLLQVGGVVEFMSHYPERPKSETLRYMSGRALQFMSAFTDQLETQVGGQGGT